MSGFDDAGNYEAHCYGCPATVPYSNFEQEGWRSFRIGDPGWWMFYAYCAFCTPNMIALENAGALATMSLPAPGGGDAPPIARDVQGSGTATANADETSPAKERGLNYSAVIGLSLGGLALFLPVGFASDRQGEYLVAAILLAIVGMTALTWLADVAVCHWRKRAKTSWLRRQLHRPAWLRIGEVVDEIGQRLSVAGETMKEWAE